MKSSISNIFNEIIKPRFLICQDYDMLLKNEIRGDLYIYVRKILDSIIDSNSYYKFNIN